MSRGRGAPAEQRIRDAAPASPPGRDTAPAVGTRGEAAPWRRAVEGARVALVREAFEDASWSFLFRGESRYAATTKPGRKSSQYETPVGPVGGGAGHADEPGRKSSHYETPVGPVVVAGPVIKAPVWTWEVPLYFWFGGIAAGSSFVAVACEVAGDQRSARVARLVALGAIAPGAPLLIADLGRPGRFLNMLRIFKPRSPMSMGAWCLAAFSTTLSGAVGADLLGRARERRALTGATALLGTYLGSYTGALLASTAVPLWSRSRSFLGPVFVCTAVATGASATRLALAATGTRRDHPTRTALGAVETGAMAAELILSLVNERRLGPLGDAMAVGRPGRQFRFAKSATTAGLALRLARRAGHASSVAFLVSGLVFRYAWVGAGKASARDDEAVARTARPA